MEPIMTLLAYEKADSGDTVGQDDRIIEFIKE